MKIINRQARYNYHILEVVEAGIVLSGFEVKSVRLGRVDLSQSFAKIQSNQVILKNAYIHPFQDQKNKGYNSRGDRKLLLHKRQISNLSGKIGKSGAILIPLSCYIKRNIIKVELALASPKRKYDRKKEIRARDEQRKVEEELKGIY